MHTYPKIKVFIDAHSFDREHQGTRAFIKRLYTALSKNSKNLELHFGAASTENLRRELSDIPGASFVRYRFSSSFMRLAIEIPWILYRNKFDFAHFQYISPLFKPCRTIVTTHDVLFLDFKTHFPLLYRISRKYLFRFSLSRADIKSTVSEYSKQRIQEHFRISKNDILVIPNGVSQEYYENFRREDSIQHVSEKYNIGQFILFVSRFEPRKNHEVVLRTYLHLKLYEKSIFLALLGHESIPTPRLKKALSKLDPEIRKYIIILDQACDEDLLHFYRAAVLFIYLSQAEGFGLPPIEAAVLGTPVICSNTTALSDFSFFGENHVNPHDFEAITRRVMEILSNPVPRRQLDVIADEIKMRYSFAESAKILEEAIIKRFAAPL